MLVVINNQGGRIFERLPRIQGLAEDELDLIVNGHDQQFESWAAMWGLEYQLVTGREDFEVTEREGPLVLEVRPDDQQTDAFWKDWES